MSIIIACPFMIPKEEGTFLVWFGSRGHVVHHVISEVTISRDEIHIEISEDARTVSVLGPKSVNGEGLAG